jgi:hypothetical protein
MNNEIPSLGAIEFLEAKINFYPNPTFNKFTIDSPALIEKLEIRDLNGKILVNLVNLCSKQVDIDLSSFFSGVYIIDLGTSREKISKLLFKN